MPQLDKVFDPARSTLVISPIPKPARMLTPLTVHVAQDLQAAGAHLAAVSRPHRGREYNHSKRGRYGEEVATMRGNRLRHGAQLLSEGPVPPGPMFLFVSRCTGAFRRSMAITSNETVAIDQRIQPPHRHCREIDSRRTGSCGPVVCHVERFAASIPRGVVAMPMLRCHSTCERQGSVLGSVTEQRGLRRIG